MNGFESGGEDGGPPDGFTLVPVRLSTTPEGEEGRLVISTGGLLVAVLVLIDPTAEDADVVAGSWFLEAGFRPCQTAVPPIFAGLSQARVWIAEKMRAGLIS